jgi:hypothetical protein
VSRAFDRPWFLDLFERVTPASGDRWRAECPRCGSKRAVEFTPREAKWGITAYCGCEERDALATVELHLDDLLYESEWTRGRGEGLRGRSRRPVDPLSHSGDSIGGDEAEVDGLLERFYAGALPEARPTSLRLPRGARGSMRRVAGFMAVLFAVREFAGLPLEAIVDSHWAARWIGMPQKTVWRALRDLVDAGVLADAGRRYGRGGRRGPRLYAPGPLADDAAVGGGDDRAQLLGREPRVEPETPRVEAGLGEEVAERVEAVAVREAPLAAGGLSASGGGAAGDGVLGHGLSPGDGNAAPDGTPPRGRGNAP